MDHLKENILSTHRFFKMNYGELLLCLFLLMVGFTISGVIQFAASSAFSYDAIMQFGQPIFYTLPFLFCIFAYYNLRLKPDNLQYHFGFQPSPWYYYPIMVLMFFGAMLINEPIADSIPKSGLYGILDNLYKLMEQIEKSLEAYPKSTAFTVVILAPLLEETVFRGMILKGLLNNKVQPFLAIFISAMVFAIFHFNPWQFVGALFLGLILGWVYYKTQSLTNTIFLHFFNNGLSALLFFVYKEMNFFSILNLSIWGSLFFGSLLMFGFGYLFYHFTKNHQWKFY